MELQLRGQLSPHRRPTPLRHQSTTTPSGSSSNLWLNSSRCRCNQCQYISPQFNLSQWLSLWLLPTPTNQVPPCNQRWLLRLSSQCSPLSRLLGLHTLTSLPSKCSSLLPQLPCSQLFPSQQPRATQTPQLLTSQEPQCSLVPHRRD